MSKTAKRLALLLTALVLGSALSGCKKPEVTTGTGEQTKNTTPTEISIFFDGTSTTTDRNNNPVIREIEKKSNTKLTVVEAPNGQGNEKLNLLISSGQVPMLVKAGNGIINKYGIEGAMYPLEEVIDKYMPNAKKILTKETINLLKASDNKLYNMPLIRDTGYGAFFIREDWLKKLNLSVPKTLDEYYNVLKAITNNDPDGNGKKDTFGTAMTENIGKLELLCGPYNLPVGEWMKGSDGSYVFSSIDPNMKKALEFGIKIYKEGLMDPEFATLKGPQYDEKVTNNKIGLMHNWSSGAMKLEGLLQKTVPDAKYAVMDVPTAPGISKGQSSVSTLLPGTKEKSINGYMGFSKTIKEKDLEKVAKFVDWHFTEEGARVNTFGVEGVHYTMENGKPKYKAAYYGAEKISERQKEGLWDTYILAGDIDQRTDGWPQVWLPQSITYMEKTIKTAWPKEIYFATPTGDAINPEITKARQEIFTKIIMGGLSLDDGWNQWLKEFDRIGGNKWTKEVNDIVKARK